MTQKQKNWAASHDWFIGEIDSGVICQDDMEIDATIIFTDFQELKAWAGY